MVKSRLEQDYSDWGKKKKRGTNRYFLMLNINPLFFSKIVFNSLASDIMINILVISCQIMNFPSLNNGP